MKRSLVIFPFRSPAGGVQPTLPPCRGWRIVARRAGDFAATAPPVAAGEAPAEPAGAFDGAYPVYVRVTDKSGAEVRGLLFVDGDGWNLQPMGPSWRIEYVSAGSANGDRFVYVVETIDDVSEAGQVNGALARPPSATLRDLKYIASADLTVPVVLEFPRPAWAQRGRLSVHAVYAAGASRNIATGGSLQVILAREAGPVGFGTAASRALYQVSNGPQVVGPGTGIADFADEQVTLLGVFGADASNVAAQNPGLNGQAVLDPGIPPDRVIARCWVSIGPGTLGLGVPIWMDWA